MQASVWFQKCYDVDCHGFRSEAMPLPPEVLPQPQGAATSATLDSTPTPPLVHPVPAFPAGPALGICRAGAAATVTPVAEPGHPAGARAGGRAGPEYDLGFHAWSASEAGEEAAMVAALDAASAARDGRRSSGLRGSFGACQMSEGEAAWEGGNAEQEAAMVAALERAEASMGGVHDEL